MMKSFLYYASFQQTLMLFRGFYPPNLDTKLGAFPLPSTSPSSLLPFLPLLLSLPFLPSP